MYTIEYTHRGKAVNDWDLEFWPENINHILQKNLSTDHHLMTYRVSTENVLYAICEAVATGILDHKRIQFKYEDQIISINEFGVCESHPDGFHDVTAKMCEKTIMAAIHKRKQIRAQLLEKQ